VRVFAEEELDQVRRARGQNKDLARSAAALAAQILELHSQGLGRKAIARRLGLSRRAVGRIIAGGQAP
jgi:DNA-binding transcriptional regulator LsrR (DeoR family)